MVAKFEQLPGELIMFIIEFIENPLLLFLNLNSTINRILSDHRIKLNYKIENHLYYIASLPTSLTRLVSMNFRGGDLRRFQNLKSLILCINENIVGKFRFPSSLEYLKISFNMEIPSSLFHSLSTLKRLQTLVINSKQRINVTFPADLILFSRNMKILQLENIPIEISSIYNLEELPKLKYLNIQLSEADELFHNTPFTSFSTLKTLIIHFQLSFTDLEHVLSAFDGDHLEHLELYSQTNISQTDYFDGKRWSKLFERFQKLTKCQIELRQKGRRGIYDNLLREFQRELKETNELKEKWNMKCYRSCPGYHGTVVSVQISASL
ncbi:unnamed protein product [Adineta steineri]|uniref:F-box domain-containing protein n=1 Tax=Adineta steineri TaxID=433720 RepID=A0A814RQM0_9BILA|nr:unnamed protein product [Adineta steineri]